MNPQRAQPRSGEQLTVADYLQLDYQFPNAKYAYLDGTISLLAGGSREHDDIAFNTRSALKQHFKSGPCFVQGSDMRVMVFEACYLYPDVTVSCDVADHRRGNRLIRSPRIVAEVLSPSTEKADRTSEFQAYQACATIQEIVLISQFAPHVEVYRRDEQDAARWTSTLYGPGQEIVLESVDLHLSIEELYQDVNFDEPLVEE